MSSSASINDLSDKLVYSVCEFLPHTSCAVLAVALTAPSTSWKKYQWKISPNTTSKAIISSIKHHNSYKTVLKEMMNHWSTEIGFISCYQCYQIECSCCSLYLWCDDCGRTYCSDCESRMDEYAKVSYCSKDDYSYDITCPAICGSCRTRNCCNGTNDCYNCKAMVFDKKLVEKNNKQTKIDQLRRQIEELRVSNE